VSLLLLRVFLRFLIGISRLHWRSVFLINMDILNLNKSKVFKIKLRHHRRGWCSVLEELPVDEDVVLSPFVLLHLDVLIPEAIVIIVIVEG